MGLILDSSESMKSFPSMDIVLDMIGRCCHRKCILKKLRVIPQQVTELVNLGKGSFCRFEILKNKLG